LHDTGNGEKKMLPLPPTKEEEAEMDVEKRNGARYQNIM
jgi:hypothetical protein